MDIHIQVTSAHIQAACQHSWAHKRGQINTRQIQKFRAEVSTPRPHSYIICNEKLHSNLGLEHHLSIFAWQPAFQPIIMIVALRHERFHMPDLGSHGGF